MALFTFAADNGYCLHGSWYQAGYDAAHSGDASFSGGMDSFCLGRSLSCCRSVLSFSPHIPADHLTRHYVLYAHNYALAFLTCVVGGLGAILSGIAVLGILATLSILQILFSLRYLPE